jgi:hypothetical protein
VGRDGRRALVWRAIGLSGLPDVILRVYVEKTIYIHLVVSDKAGRCLNRCLNRAECSQTISLPPGLVSSINTFGTIHDLTYRPFTQTNDQPYDTQKVTFPLATLDVRYVSERA